MIITHSQTKIEYKYIYKVTFLLYQLFIFLNRFVIYIFLDKEIVKKKFLPVGGLQLFSFHPAGEEETNNFLRLANSFLALTIFAKHSILDL